MEKPYNIPYKIEELPLLIMEGKVKLNNLSNNLLERLLDYCELKYKDTKNKIYYTVSEIIKEYIR